MVKIKVSKCPVEYRSEISTLEASGQDFEDLELDAKLFVFDKDGTLLTHNHFVPILEKRLELLSEKFKLSPDELNDLTRLLGLDPDTHEIITGGTMFIARKDSQILIETFLLQKTRNRSKIFRQVTDIFQEADKQIDLEKFVEAFPEVPSFLNQLKENGVKIAIATHDTTAAALNQLAAADIDRYLDLIIGLDYNEKILHKPSSTMLLEACEEFNIPPQDSIVVGDSVNDVLMGKAGGAGLSVGVLTGEHNFGDFKDYDAIISSIADFKIID
jgi:phosphoglycolate phosphatase